MDRFGKISNDNKSVIAKSIFFSSLGFMFLVSVLGLMFANPAIIIAGAVMGASVVAGASAVSIAKHVYNLRFDKVHNNKQNNKFVYVDKNNQIQNITEDDINKALMSDRVVDKIKGSEIVVEDKQDYIAERLIAIPKMTNLRATKISSLLSKVENTKAEDVDVNLVNIDVEDNTSKILSTNSKPVESKVSRVSVASRFADNYSGVFNVTEEDFKNVNVVLRVSEIDADLYSKHIANVDNREVLLDDAQRLI